LGVQRARSTNVQEGKAMKRRGIAIVAGVLAGMICTAALAAGPSDWVAINSPKELRALYSNTTFEGTLPNGSHFVGYYRADGRGLLISGSRRIARTWKVEGDKVCVKDTRGANCFRFERNRLQHDRIVGRHAPDGWEFAFTVKKGVPNF
jgi:hypothetical protein